jgi:hypothetical protein
MQRINELSPSNLRNNLLQVLTVQCESLSARTSLHGIAFSLYIVTLEYYPTMGLKLRCMPTASVSPLQHSGYPMYHMT